MSKVNLSFLVFLVSAFAFSFPESIRHGYMNCTTCHMSPNGGGVLTPYGRGLSKEAFSTWGTEAETKPLYFIDPPDTVHIGGDVRLLQYHLDTPTYKEGRFILMQADLEAGASFDKFTFIGTIGRSIYDNPHTMEEFLVSRRHYLQYQATNEISIRAGRFFPAFGIAFADHTVPTRVGLGFDQNRESYNLEASYIGERIDAFLTLNFGRIDQPSYKRDRGFALRSSMNFEEKYKVGLGYYFGHNETRDRHLFGPYALLAITKELVFIQETDFQRSIPGSGATGTWGWATYSKLDYEPIQGIHFYGHGGVARSDFKSPNTQVDSYGVGIQFLPRPHFEFLAEYLKTKNFAVDPNNRNDMLWIQGHFYL